MFQAKVVFASDSVLQYVMLFSTNFFCTMTYYIIFVFVKIQLQQKDRKY